MIYLKRNIQKYFGTYIVKIVETVLCFESVNFGLKTRYGSILYAPIALCSGLRQKYRFKN